MMPKPKNIFVLLIVFCVQILCQIDSIYFSNTLHSYEIDNLRNQYESIGYNVTEMFRQPISPILYENYTINTRFDKGMQKNIYDPVLFQVFSNETDIALTAGFDVYVRFDNFTGKSNYSCSFTMDNINFINFTYDPINLYAISCKNIFLADVFYTPENYSCPDNGAQSCPLCYAPSSPDLLYRQTTCDVYDCSGTSSYLLEVFTTSYPNSGNDISGSAYIRTVYLIDKCPVATNCQNGCNYANSSFSIINNTEQANVQMTINQTSDTAPLGGYCYLFGKYNSTSLSNLTGEVTFLQASYYIDNSTNINITFCDGVINNQNNCTLYTYPNETIYTMYCCYEHPTVIDSKYLINVNISGSTGIQDYNYCPIETILPTPTPIPQSNPCDNYWMFKIDIPDITNNFFILQNSTMYNSSSNQFTVSCQLTLTRNPSTNLSINFTYSAAASTFNITSCPFPFSFIFGRQCGDMIMTDYTNIQLNCLTDNLIIYDNPILSITTMSTNFNYYQSNFTCPISTTTPPTTSRPSTLTPSTLTPSTLSPSTLSPSTLSPSTLTPSIITSTELQPSTVSSTLPPEPTNSSTIIPTIIPPAQNYCYNNWTSKIIFDPSPTSFTLYTATQTNDDGGILYFANCRISAIWSSAPLIVEFYVDTNGNYLITNCPYPYIYYSNHCARGAEPDLTNVVMECTINDTLIIGNPVITIFVNKNGNEFPISANFTCPIETTTPPTTLSPTTLSPTTLPPSGTPCNDGWISQTILANVTNFSTFGLYNSELVNLQGPLYFSSCHLSARYFGNVYDIYFEIDSNNNFSVTTCPNVFISYPGYCGSDTILINSVDLVCYVQNTSIIGTLTNNIYYTSNGQNYSASLAYTCNSTTSPPTLIPTSPPLQDQCNMTAVFNFNPSPTSFAIANAEITNYNDTLFTSCQATGFYNSSPFTISFFIGLNNIFTIIECTPPLVYYNGICGTGQEVLSNVSLSCVMLQQTSSGDPIININVYINRANFTISSNYSCQNQSDPSYTYPSFTISPSTPPTQTTCVGSPTFVTSIYDLQPITINTQQARFNLYSAQSFNFLGPTYVSNCIITLNVLDTLYYIHFSTDESGQYINLDCPIFPFDHCGSGPSPYFIFVGLNCTLQNTTLVGNPMTIVNFDKDGQNYSVPYYYTCDSQNTPSPTPSPSKVCDGIWTSLHNFTYSTNSSLYLITTINYNSEGIIYPSKCQGVFNDVPFSFDFYSSAISNVTCPPEIDNSGGDGFCGSTDTIFYFVQVNCSILTNQILGDPTYEMLYVENGAISSYIANYTCQQLPGSPTTTIPTTTPSTTTPTTTPSTITPTTTPSTSIPTTIPNVTQKTCDGIWRNQINLTYSVNISWVLLYIDGYNTGGGAVYQTDCQIFLNDASFNLTFYGDVILNNTCPAELRNTTGICGSNDNIFYSVLINCYIENHTITGDPKIYLLLLENSFGNVIINNYTCQPDLSMSTPPTLIPTTVPSIIPTTLPTPVPSTVKPIINDNTAWMKLSISDTEDLDKQYYCSGKRINYPPECTSEQECCSDLCKISQKGKICHIDNTSRKIVTCDGKTATCLTSTSQTKYKNNSIYTRKFNLIQ